jgi:hypothetical protein
VVERIAEIVILAEDLRQANFAWHYLKHDGHSYRSLRVKISPKGRGAGEQYVRECYPDEVTNYRSSSARRRAALIVEIDADTKTVYYRERQLESELNHARVANRKKSERIALLIPKRNIETWILCLTGEEVNETTDCKSTKDVDGKIKQAAENFFEWSRDGYPLPTHCVASLQKGLKEIRRVD